MKTNYTSAFAMLAVASQLTAASLNGSDLTSGYDEFRGLRGFVPGKSGFRTLQRMETPVIYFYSASAVDVNVAVKFPQGVITEWYPQAKPLPPPSAGQLPPLRKELEWKQVGILPQGPVIDLPGDGSGSHYYAARETDSNPVNIQLPGGERQVEKFLFYRGVGNFHAPLVVTMSAENSVTVRNDGLQTIQDAFVYESHGGRGNFYAVDSLPAGASRTIQLAPNEAKVSLGAVRNQLEAALRSALVEAGLYEKEAAAMVKTWDDSWLGEPGLRVLYVLPRSWTDAVLPLKVEPAPHQAVRVMVGRAEMISPQTELALLSEVMRFLDGGAGERFEAIASVRRLALGRFLEPAVRSVVNHGPKTRKFSDPAWQLWSAANTPGSKDEAKLLDEVAFQCSGAILDAKP
jgi:hypothetical protein